MKKKLGILGVFLVSSSLIHAALIARADFQGMTGSNLPFVDYAGAANQFVWVPLTRNGQAQNTRYTVGGNEMTVVPPMNWGGTLARMTATRTLEPGQTLSLSVTVYFSAEQGASDRGFSFGFTTEGDQTRSVGLRVGSGTHTAFRISRETETAVSGEGGTFAEFPGSTGSSIASGVDTEPVALFFSVHKTESNYVYQASVDGRMRSVASTEGWDQFDAVFLRIGNQSIPGGLRDLKVSKVLVSLDPAPGGLPPEAADFVVTMPSETRVVYDTLGGVNYLWNRDKPYGTWGDRMLEVGSTFARWPGGGLTENEEDFLALYFDDDGTRDWGAEYGNDPDHGGRSSLREYIQWANEHDMTTALVVPMIRYTATNGVVDTVRFRREVGGFLTRLATNYYGTLSNRVEIIEIGNESNTGWSWLNATNYARASLMIEPILREYMPWPVQVGIQDGNWPVIEMDRIANWLTTAQKQRFDFVIHHSYPWKLNDLKIDTEIEKLQSYWPGLDINMSEWNVAARQPFESPVELHAYGMEQAGMVWRLFDSFVKYGVRYANFWALQQNNRTSAYPTENVEWWREPFVAGWQLRWINDLVGYHRLNVAGSFSDDVAVFAYQQGHRLEIMVSGGSAAESEITVALPFSAVRIDQTVRLHHEPTDDRVRPNHNPVQVDLTGTVLTVPINMTSPEDFTRISATLMTYDGDGDGLPDYWEVEHGLDPYDATGYHGADGDPDGDGLSNREEFFYGTDPQVADAPPILYLDETNALFQLSFLTTPDRVGQFQWSADLELWNDLGGAFSTAGEFDPKWIVYDDAPDAASRFYRFRISLP